MNDQTLYITKPDHDRLKNYLSSSGAVNSRDRANLQMLDAELSKARIVDPRKVPPGVVTMNSRVRVKDIDTKEEVLVTLVFPDDADMDNGKLSVLSPIGTAILGYSLGDVVEWKVPSRMRRILIKEVCYQPEAAGIYDL